MKTWLKYLALITLYLQLSACGTTPPTHYYLLSAQQPPYGDAPARHARYTSLVLGIGPIAVADYLDREPISLGAGNTLEVDMFHRWAEPLESGLARVLYENLVMELGSQNLVRFPWRSDDRPDLQLRLRLAELNRIGSQAVIRINWTLAQSATGVRRRAVFAAQTPLPDDSYDALAAGYSRLLAQFSQYMARQAAGFGATLSPGTARD